MYLLQVISNDGLLFAEKNREVRRKNLIT